MLTDRSHVLEQLLLRYLYCKPRITQSSQNADYTISFSPIHTSHSTTFPSAFVQHQQEVTYITGFYKRNRYNPQEFITAVQVTW